MTNQASASATDPIGVFVSARTSRHGSRPIPLVSTHYDISIDGGFAVVEARRVFRNSEAASIEAMLTFPLPVEAVLFSLEAENDGRKLRAKARRRKDARAVYESAIEEGKTAVLHEELLRGIHMLSVAHIAPGAEITVTTRWAMTLGWIGERWRLRIPLTVGQVYGQSPLADSDALECGGANGTAELVVRRASGRVSLAGADIADGQARVPLNRPIDINVTGADARVLRGVAADGCAVALQVAPLPAGRDTLDLAVLVDRSGSMGEACAGGGEGGSKHRAVIDGLTAFASQLRKGDAIELWDFNNEPTRIGSTRDERPHWRIVRHDWRPEKAFAQLVRALQQPDGGTEIGGALGRVLGESTARDVLLITDGKSYALDVQKLAGHGRRVAVVLVGEDSLEANVGHLAAITGGSIYVATGSDIASAVTAAAASLRSCPVERGPIDARPERIEAVRGGAVIKAEWAAGFESGGDGMAAAVTAFAAGLAISRMPEAAATELAEREGLCSHLTSLVLVDEAAAAQDGIPAMRKVPLPAPEMDMLAVRARFAPVMDYCDFGPLYALSGNDGSRERSYSHKLALRRVRSYSTASRTSTIDWDAAPADLLDGDLSSLDAALVERLEELAANPDIRLKAAELGVLPVVLVIALLAYRDRATSRTAERIARKVLGGTPDESIHELHWLLSSL